MRRINTADIPGVAKTLDLVREVSGAQSPRAAVLTFGRLIRRIRPMDGFVSTSRRGLEDGQYKITRIAIGDDLGEREYDPWKRWNELPVHTGGFLGEIMQDGKPVLLHDLYLKGDPVLGDTFASFGSCAAVPLFDGGEAINWSVVFGRSGDGLSVEDLEEMLLTNNLVGRATKHLVMADEIRALNARLTAQLERVARIQRTLLPDRLPDIPGVRMASSYLTSDEAGGDYYDFFDLGSGQWGIAVGDVSGHGAGAATLMAMLQAILHTHPDLGASPAEVLRYANRHIHAKRLEGQFVTAFYAVYDTNSGGLTFANAGHPPPRRKGGGAVEPLCGPSTVPLGIVPEIDVEVGRTSLDAGETLVLYTDGVTEAFSPPPAREQFGVERLDRALAACTGEPQCVIDSILRGLYEHTGEMTRDDDQTLLALRAER